MSDSSAVGFTLDGAVAVIQLDDGKANALSSEVIASLHAAFDRAEKEAGAVVLVGRPGRFSAGFDLSTMMSGPDGARRLVTEGAELLMRVYLHPQAVVAACTGHALAAGALMLLAADRRIGVEGDFKIGLNEVAIGLRLPVFAIELARDRLSKRHFPQASVLARVYSPIEARDAGYLDEVVAPQELVATAKAEAAHLASLPAAALAVTKRLVRAPLVEHIRETLEADMKQVAPPTQAGRP